MPSEAASRADFTSLIRYAQVWEDADILVEALDIQPDDVCLSIASAGDNALALLAQSPAKVIALDMNPSQLACLELRVAAFRRLDYDEVLELVGSAPSQRRLKLYATLRDDLSDQARTLWDAQPESIQRGIGHAGKFENYFRLFRDRIMPLIHSRRTIERLLEPRTTEERVRFYDDRWDTWRWRLLFRLFFSRTAMGRLGRDPSFFQYVEGSVADRILARTKHALTTLDPAENPYLQWILTGEHRTALPYYLRPDKYSTIHNNLDRLEWHLAPLEDYLSQSKSGPISKFNLSDIFEYLSAETSEKLFRAIAHYARPQARLAYWNMLAPRQAPTDLYKPRQELADRLFLEDKAFFYSAFIVEDLR